MQFSFFIWILWSSSCHFSPPFVATDNTLAKKSFKLKSLFFLAKKNATNQ